VARFRKVKPAIAGSRVGTKRSDTRWEAEGEIWASRFEYLVYRALKDAGHDVRKTVPEDSMVYHHPVKNGRCTECGSAACVTERRYTPDLYVRPARSQEASSKHGGYFVEAKGYLRADKRSLLRSLRKARPDVDLRLLVQRDYKVGRGSLVSWAQKYLKVPVAVWDGNLPEDWA